MASGSLWRIFRKFRLIVLALASVLSLSWSIFIIVYMAKNWSNYDSVERGLIFALIVVDFVGSILLYLMIVVRYQFWPDAARTAVLLGLQVAGSLLFTMHSSSFPCNAFGSTTNCHTVTTIIIVGSWVISALLAMYAISLSVMAFVPRPPSVTRDDDLENLPNAGGEETRESHKSSAFAGLLKNPEGSSPESHSSELPIPPEMPATLQTHSNTSSSSSLPIAQQVNDNIGLVTVNTSSAYSDLSRSSFVEIIRARENANRGLNSSHSLPLQRHPSPRSDSIQLTPLPNHFAGEYLDANRVSVASSSEPSTYEFPVIAPTIAEVPHRTPSTTTGSSASVYSQSTARPQSPSTSVLAHTSTPTSRTPRRNPHALTLTPDIAGRSSVHSMMASVHDHAEPQSSAANYDITSNGFLTPSLTALPPPLFSGGATETPLELYLSNFPQRDSSGDDADLVTLRAPTSVQHSAPVRPSVNHVRTDSTTSNVDLDEWKRLVLTAAGRDQDTS